MMPLLDVNVFCAGVKRRYFSERYSDFLINILLRLDSCSEFLISFGAFMEMEKDIVFIKLITFQQDSCPVQIKSANESRWQGKKRLRLNKRDAHQDD